MGICVAEVTFVAPAPLATQIAAQVEQSAGLPVVLRESGPEIRGTLHDLHALITFQMHPRIEVELTAYRAGGVKEHLQIAGVDSLPIAKAVQGMNEAPGEQTVYVRGHLGQEPTLFFATVLALEALGGRPRDPVTDDVRRQYGHAISPEELKRRHRKVQRHGIVMLTAAVVLFPLLLPLWILSIAWQLVKMPWRIWKARRLIQNHLRPPAK